MPETEVPDTNMYDARLTAHEDGWIYAIFCAERKDPAAVREICLRRWHLLQLPGQKI